MNSRFQPSLGGRGPRHVKHSLNRLLSSFGSPSADVLVTLFEQWSAIVGAELAAHARPTRLVQGRLTVDVEDSAWAVQLRLRESELLGQLAKHLGPGKVQFIRPRIRNRTHRERSQSR